MMRYLAGEEEQKAVAYIDRAAQIARHSTCLRSRCGSVIVKENDIIGSGFNSPPQDREDQRQCSYSKEGYHRKVTDRTCCVHAEQHATMDALRTHPDKLDGSRLYFIRLDGEGNKTVAGKPYCTICSKMALDVGIAEFALWQEEGVCVYPTDEYNTLSFQFNG